MNVRPLALLVVAPAAFLASCQTTSRPAQPETVAIEYRIGRCFGFCPAWSARIERSGLLSFDGEANTDVTGHAERRVDPAIYGEVETLAEQIRPDTPGDHEADVACKNRVSDQSHLWIRWHDAAGGVRSVHHDPGCRGLAADALTERMLAIGALMPVERWTGMGE